MLARITLFGNSSMPSVGEFDYSFDNLALVIEKFTRQVGLSRYTLYSAGLRRTHRIPPGGKNTRNKCRRS